MTRINKIFLFTLALIVSLASPTAMAAKGDKSSSEKQWYLRNTVTVIHPDTGVRYDGVNPAILGKLNESSDGFDRHDLVPYSSILNAPASVGFIQNDWGENSGQYLSDYRSSKGKNDSWVMTVFSSIDSAEVVLQWEGIYELTSKDSGQFSQYRNLDSRTLENLHLIDLETLEVIDAVTNGKLNRYTFVMNQEGSRNFRWVLGTVKSSDFEEAKAIKDQISEQKWAEKQSQFNSKENKNAHPKFGSPPGHD